MLLPWPRSSFAGASLLFLFLGSGAPAAAQTGQGQSPAQRDTARPVLEEIIVTAEKRAENLQELSQAVSVATTDDLAARNILSFVDFGSTVPGVTVAKNEGFKTVISIRGIGNEANQNAIANPSVSYHLDGIYVASPFALHNDFLDVERVEVLRGPQGTLFGQNSTGGAMNVVTAAPEPGLFFGTADVTLGDYDLIRTRASLNVPLGDDAALRASASSHRHSGFSHNIVLDQALDQADNQAARARLSWTPGSGRFRLHMTAQAQRENTNGAAQKGILDPTRDARSLAQDSPGLFALDTSLYSVVAEWDFASVTFKSLTSYQDDDITVVRDNDRNDLASLPPFRLVPSVFDPEINRQRTFTQEFNLVSAAGGRFDWVAGVFYLDTEVEVSIREYLDFGFDGVFDPVSVADVRAFAFGDYGFISDSVPERDSFSVYGQGTLSLSDSARIIAGARHTDDEVYSAVTNFFGRAGTAILATESNAVTGRLALEVDVGEQAMLYGAFTRGFKPGGSNLTYGREDIVAPIVVLPTFADETIDAWEAGLKADFAMRRVRVNAALFHYDYRNLQYHATDPEVFEGGVGNIPAAESRGAEIEVESFVSGRLSLGLRLAWLQTEITESHLALDNVRSDTATNALLAQGAPLFGDRIQQARAAAIRDVQGNELAKTPEFTSDVLLTYIGAAGEWGDWRAHLQYTYRSSFWHRVFNNPTTDIAPSYAVWNVTVGLLPHHADWYLDLVVANVTDEAGVNARFTDVFGVGATGDELIPPRQVMVRWGWDF